MIKVLYPEENENVREIRDRLVDLSLAFKMVHHPDLRDIQVEEGKKVKTGMEEINVLLDEIALEMDQWGHCHC